MPQSLDADRVQRIKRLIAAGHPCKAVARTLGVSLSSVYKHSYETLKADTGRPRKLSEAEERRLLTAMRAKVARADVAERFGFNSIPALRSYMTMARRRAQARTAAQRPIPGPGESQGGSTGLPGYPR